MSDSQAAEEAWERIEGRCRYLAPTTPVAGVLAIVRDVLLSPARHVREQHSSECATCGQSWPCDAGWSTRNSPAVRISEAAPIVPQEGDEPYPQTDRPASPMEHP